jgi:hypothetical protein
MTDDRADQEALELLHRLGQVDAPDTASLAAARESLWSAITDELLSGGSTGDVGRPEQRGEARRPAGRPRPDQQRQARRHRGGRSD